MYIAGAQPPDRRISTSLRAQPFSRAGPWLSFQARARARPATQLRTPPQHPSVPRVLSDSSNQCLPQPQHCKAGARPSDALPAAPARVGGTSCAAAAPVASGSLDPAFAFAPLAREQSSAPGGAGGQSLGTHVVMRPVTSVRSRRSGLRTWQGAAAEDYRHSEGTLSEGRVCMRYAQPCALKRPGRDSRWQRMRSTPPATAGSLQCLPSRLERPRAGGARRGSQTPRLRNTHLSARYMLYVILL